MTPKHRGEANGGICWLLFMSVLGLDTGPAAIGVVP